MTVVGDCDVTRPELMTHCAVPPEPSDWVSPPLAHERAGNLPGPLVGAGSANVNVTVPVGVAVAPAALTVAVKVTGAP